VAEPKDVLDEAYELYDAAHIEEALDLVRPLLSRQGALQHEQRLSLLRLVGRCSLELGDYERARQAFDAAARIAPDLDRLDLAVTLFYLCRFDEAEMLLETLPIYPEIEGEVYWYRGLLAERRADFERADSLFRRAARLDAKRFIVPQRIEENEVRDVYDSVLEEFPPDMRSAAIEVPVLIEDLPSDEVLEDSAGRLHPLILGLYSGIPLDRKSTMAPAPEVDRIILFRRNIAKISHSREDLQRELRQTLIHEIGHHFGLSDEELEDRGRWHRPRTVLSVLWVLFVLSIRGHGPSRFPLGFVVGRPGVPRRLGGAGVEREADDGGGIEDRLASRRPMAEEGGRRE